MENLRPGAKAVAAASAAWPPAAGLMLALQTAVIGPLSYASLTYLGATLQVYFHLGDLPGATW